ncbi:MAG: hypothetical protein WC783_00775 [Candidatus Paceibacterota bacterium]|jgi:hypothetical protein
MKKFNIETDERAKAYGRKKAHEPICPSTKGIIKFAKCQKCAYFKGIDEGFDQFDIICEHPLECESCN